MGGKSSPDYSGAAAAQGEANREVVRDQTFANRPNQYTPWGYTEWTPSQGVDPSTGEATNTWTQTTGLTPELQSILDKQVAIQGGRSDVAGALTGRMGAEFAAPMDWSGLSPMGGVPVGQFTMPENTIGNPYKTRQKAEDAVYSQAMSRLNPRFDTERRNLEITLRNRGLQPGDAAYDSAMASQGRNENDAVNQAIWSSVGEGRSEAGQMFGMQAQRGAQNFQQALDANRQNFNMAATQSNMANRIRQQQLTEAMQRRGFSLNEINALLYGQQVGMPQMPSFSNASAAAPAPVYQGAVDAGNYQQLGLNNVLQGITGLAGAGASLF